MKKSICCPCCHQEFEVWRNPLPTVDIIIYVEGRGVVLVERSKEPFGWALPGGFVDYGESCETAARREAYEETGLVVELTGLLGVYSDPRRDPRQHTLSVVYMAQTAKPEQIQAGDDAAKACFFTLDNLPALVFDHTHILSDYRAVMNNQRASIAL